MLHKSEGKEWPTTTRKGRMRNNFLLNVMAKNRSCCKKQPLLGYSFLLPETEDKEVKNVETDTHYYYSGIHESI